MTMHAGPTLGTLIRALRSRNAWTLQEMSDKTGIPRSTLAKVEHDRLTLGYDKLLQISQRLKIRMSELFAPDDELASRAMTRRSVGTLETAVHVGTSSYEYYFLCPDLRQKRMIPIFGRVLAKTLEEFGELMRHPGEEFIYVLTGRVELHTEFYQPVVLEPGQCAYIDSAMGHAYLLGPGCEEATLVCGCTTPDDELLGILNKSTVPELRETGVRLVEPVAPKAKKKAPPRPRARHRRG